MATATKVDLGELSRELFGHFDRHDMAAMLAMMDDTVQGVDEVSRTWMRGKEAIGGYFDVLGELGIENTTSKLSDVRTDVWGDTGLATFMIEQSYTADGERQTITAPATILFRRRGDEWCISLIHAVALPENA